MKNIYALPVHENETGNEKMLFYYFKIITIF